MQHPRIDKDTVTDRQCTFFTACGGQHRTLGHDQHLQILMPVPWHRVDLQLIMVARDRKRRRAVGVQLTPVFVQLCAAGAKRHSYYLHFDGIVPESRRIPRIIPPLLMV